MGLDQRLVGRLDAEHPDAGGVFMDKRVTRICVDLGEWRNHRDLHSFIVQNFGFVEDPPYSIELTQGDLRKIIDAIKDDLFLHKPDDCETFEEAMRWFSEHEQDPDWWVGVVYEAG